MSFGKKDVTIVLPTLNEEEAISKVISELKRGGNENILIVDGYSKDRTVEVARKAGVRVIYQRGEGKASAIRTAIDHVNTPIMLVMDGDWTYDSNDISRLLEETDGHEYIIGERVQKENISWLHRLGNYGINMVFNLLMGTRFRDVCSGMYLLRTDWGKKLAFPFKGFECEVAIRAQLANKAKEVPIGYRARVGEKKLSGVLELARILFAALYLSRRCKPSNLRFLAALVIATFGVGAAVLLAFPTLLR